MSLDRFDAEFDANLGIFASPSVAPATNQMAPIPPSTGGKRPTDPPPPPPKLTGPVALKDWLSRATPDEDPIMGAWLTTTSRTIASADTGLGKTMFLMGLGLSAAAGIGFCHWASGRPARVLYVDGEMASRLMKDRLQEECTRLGVEPATFFLLSHEDIEDFAPLNSEAGQAFIRKFVEEYSIDIVIFDNIMSLLLGEMKDEEPWRQTVPLVKWLTKRKTGQIWINHTGYDASRGYGTKIREWLMDNVVHFDKAERDDTDVSFELKFTKARNRRPENRQQFAPTKIALLNDEWTYSAGEQDKTKSAPKTEAGSQKTFREAVTHVMLDQVQMKRVRPDSPLIEAVPVAAVRIEFNRRHATGEPDKKKRADACKKAFSRVLHGSTPGLPAGFVTWADELETEWIGKVT